MELTTLCKESALKAILESAHRYYVYLLIRPDRCEPFYVGKGKGNRLFEHEIEASKQDRPSHKLSIIRKHGVLYSLFGFFELEADAYRAEKELIAAIGRERLTNQTHGGEGGGFLGKKMQEETKEKIRKALLGKKHSAERIKNITEARKGIPMREEVRQKMFGRAAPNKGVPMTDEQKAKLSAALRGKVPGKMTEERKAKIGAANRGKIRSDEAKEKIRKALTGRKLTKEHLQKLYGRVPKNKGVVGAYQHTDDAKARIGAASATRVRTEETRRRQSVAIKAAFAKRRQEQMGAQS